MPPPPPTDRRRRRHSNEREADSRALTWHEAKRVLLLSAGSRLAFAAEAANSGRSRLDRRAANQATTSPSGNLAISENTVGSTQKSVDHPVTQQPERAPKITTPSISTTTAGTSTKATSSDSLGDQSNQDKLQLQQRNQMDQRRQRHRSQQEGANQSQTLNMTASIESLAAAMLPFLWPSYQITGGVSPPPSLQSAVSQSTHWPLKYQHLSRVRSTPNKTSIEIGHPVETNAFTASSLTVETDSPDDSRGASSPRVSVSDPPPSRRNWSSIPTTTSATRSSMSSACDSTTPTSLTLPVDWSGHSTSEKNRIETTTPLSLASELMKPETSVRQTSTPPIEQTSTNSAPFPTRAARERRKKPNYLHAGSSTPYLDSTRLASKYSLPRIKFNERLSALANRVQLAETASLFASPSVTSSSPTRNAKKAAFATASTQIPKGLSKLIEQQLQTNATNLLKAHKQQQILQASNSFSSNRLPPPSTSFSKVVRLVLTDSPKGLPITTITTSTSTTTRRPAILMARTPKPTSITEGSTNTSGSLAITSTTTATSSLSRELQLDRTTIRPIEVPTWALTTPLTTTTTAGTTSETPKTTPPTTTTIQPSPPMTSSTSRLPIVETKNSSDLAEINKLELASPAHSAKPAKSWRTHSMNQQLKKANSNIRLFQFKRKPDVAKLPFYKKPLNYTELGWTREQIQEHLELIAAAESGNSTSPYQKLSEEPLKRKRRGKSQFERLMAELHSHSSQTVDGDESESSSVSTTEVLSPLEMDIIEPIALIGEDQNQRVPVMKKRVEPLVMKPIFFVLNQKRRKDQALETQSSGSPAKISTTEQFSTITVEPTTTEAPPNASKPIVRMRRKNQGEIPVSHSSGNPRWIPRKPLGTDQMMLVPSSLLTPSGSHPVPWFSGNNMQILAQQSHDLREQSSGWRPSLSIEPRPHLDQTGSIDQLLASTSERIRPSPSTVVEGPSEGAKQQEKQSSQHVAETNSSSPKAASQQPMTEPGLRVPKLLVRPMRPAKYSLNGYIPKPSLSNQQQTSSGTMAPSQHHHQSSLPGQKSKPRNFASREQMPFMSNKDLQQDSSISNEIFSRRRGLQQHQRFASNATLSSTSPSFFANIMQHHHQQQEQQPVQAPAQTTGQQMQTRASGINKGLTGTSGSTMLSQMSAKQLQMEEKKRKYVEQQQLSLRSPTISVQKANAIKAKLGLVVSQATTKPNERSRQPGSSDSQQASLRVSVATDPASETSGELTDIRQTTGSSTAALSTIPKTDFECTDKKGKFVSGLFADHKTGCQVWHLCSNNRKYSFLCPHGTIFNAKLRICDWRYNVKCDRPMLS